MAITLMDLQKSVLNLLSEPFNSTVADLPTGSGGAATLPTITPTSSSIASAIKQFLNDGAAEIARSCYPVPETGTLAWAAGARTSPIASFTPSTTGQVLWTVRGAKYITTTYSDLVIDGSASSKVTSAGNPFVSANVGQCLEITSGTGFTSGTYLVNSVSSGAATLSAPVGSTGSTGGTGNLSPNALTYCERAALERNDFNWMTTVSGVPAYWYNDGSMSVGVYPKPSASGTVKIDGFAVPKPLVADSDTLAWIPDDLTHVLVWYACAKVAESRLEDSSIFPRADIWRANYAFSRMELWEKIDSRLRRAHFPPIAQSQASAGAGG